METHKTRKISVPSFKSEKDEATWWSGVEGRAFLKRQSSARSAAKPGGSKLVAKLARVGSVQIALRLPAPDLARARTIAKHKGIGCQTLLKMLVHEGCSAPKTNESPGRTCGYVAGPLIQSG
jgi:predicted DNA binding CopG/RHH family protein